MYTRRELTQSRETMIRESMQHGTDTPGYIAGSLRWVKAFHRSLGVDLQESNGRVRPIFNRDERGVGIRPPGCLSASEVCGLRALGEAIMGRDEFDEYCDPSGGFDFSHSYRYLQEAAIDPTSFININTFNLAISGLLNAQIMERFTNPQYIGRELVTIVPTKMNGFKEVAAGKIPPMAKGAKGRQPGESHAENQFSEMYKSHPETFEQAEKIVTTKEAAYFDWTGQVLETAGEVGDDLAYGQDQDIGDLFLGVTNLPGRYNLNGNSYEAYQAASPFINQISNQFQDVASVDRARQLYVQMVDPITGREIQINALDIFCFPARELQMRNQLFGANVQIGTQQSASGFPTYYTASANQLNTVGRGTYRLVPLTAIWRNRAIAANGLGLAGNVADLYWWIGDTKKAMTWDENWPLTPWSAPADELTMKDRGIIQVNGANYRGAAFFKEPRYMIRNTN